MTDLDHHFEQIADQRDSWTPVNLNTLPEHPPVQPTLGKVGDIGLIYPGKRHVFSGPPESAKTIAAYAIGLQITRAGHFLVLIDFEMGGYDARNRLRELGATRTDFDHLMYLDPDERAKPDHLARLIQHHPELVIIDAAAGAYSIQGLDDNKRQDVELFTNLYVNMFWRAGIATIVIDHVVKNADNRGKFVIGSERKVGSIDVHLGFDTITPIKRGSSGLYKITTQRDRNGFLKRGTLAELELISDPITHQITWVVRAAQAVDEEHPWMPTKVMQKISGILEKQTEPTTMNTLVAEAGGTRTTALEAIAALVRHGYAVETQGQRNAKLITHTKPFTVYEWENQPDPPLVRTGSPLVPEPLTLTGSVPVPPYGGPEPVNRTENQSTGSDYSWVDELAPPDDPPGDLWPESTPDDGIPF